MRWAVLLTVAVVDDLSEAVLLWASVLGLRRELDTLYSLFPTLLQNPIYVFPEKELRGLSPNFHIHVSVSDF